MWPFTNELWMPMAAMALHGRAGGDCCAAPVAGRLADGVSHETARAELAVLMAQLDAASQRKARVVTLTGTRQINQTGGALRAAPLALVLCRPARRYCCSPARTSETCSSRGHSPAGGSLRRGWQSVRTAGGSCVSW